MDLNDRPPTVPRFDPETALIYLRNRYYDPTTAQFLARDPADALTRSAYGYVGGNPLNRADPTGMYDYRYTEDIGPTSQTGSPADVMAEFMANPSAIFPFPISGCSSFSEGAVCTLHAAPTFAHGVGDVLVNHVTSTSFTFTVCSNDYFDPAGSTITFSLSQKNHELYLSQAGHAPDASWWANLTAPQIAQLTWKDQATNLPAFLGHQPQSSVGGLVLA